MDAKNVQQFPLTKVSNSRTKMSEIDDRMKRIRSKFAFNNPSVTQNFIRASSSRNIEGNDIDIPFSAQGNGISRAFQIISAIVLSPEGSIIIIEEPEMRLHIGSVEVLFDLFY